MKNEPRHYQLEGDSRRYLCFRTQWVHDGLPSDGSSRRLLLSLVPDQQEQHAFDVVTIFADDPRLRTGRDPEKVWPGP